MCNIMDYADCLSIIDLLTGEPISIQLVPERLIATPLLVFGARNFSKEIVWFHKTGRTNRRSFARKYDILLNEMDNPDGALYTDYLESTEKQRNIEPEETEF